MRAGTLRHRLTIQERSSTADAYGGQVETWTDLKTVYGAIWPLRGQEYLANKQVETSQGYKIDIAQVGVYHISNVIECRGIP